MLAKKAHAFFSHSSLSPQRGVERMRVPRPVQGSRSTLTTTLVSQMPSAFLSGRSGTLRRACRGQRRHRGTAPTPAAASTEAAGVRILGRVLRRGRGHTHG